jgi:xylitol oxidase
VSALELVTADGSLRRLSRADDPERFDGCVVSLGALGVVHTVELDLQPTYDLRLYVHEGLTLDELHADLDGILSSGYSVSVFWDWRSDDPGLAPAAVSDGEAPQQWRGATLADGPRHPIPGLPGHDVQRAAGCRRAVARAAAALPAGVHARAAARSCSRSGSSPARTASPRCEPGRPAGRASRRWCRSRGPGDRRDRLWLSPSAGRDTVALHFTWVKDEAAVARSRRRSRSGCAPSRPGRTGARCSARRRTSSAGCTSASTTSRRWCASSTRRGTFRNDLLEAYLRGPAPDYSRRKSGCPYVAAAVGPRGTDAEVREAAVEDVGAVPRAAHPHGHHLVGRHSAVRDVLADELARHAVRTVLSDGRWAKAEVLAMVADQSSA